MTERRARRAAVRLLVALCACGAPCGAVALETVDPLGYEALVERYGSALHDGRRVDVAQVEPPARIAGDEASDTRRTHVPDRSRRVFDGVTFLNVAGHALDGSAHATTTGRWFYGRGSSAAPGVSRVHIFSANEFLGGLGRPSSLGPARVWNHSWVGGTGANDARILRALDRAVTRRHWIAVCGVANSGTNPPLLSSGYNVLSVGRVDGRHAMGSAAVNRVYTDQRERPHLVAPARTASEAAPMVASVAALLLDALLASGELAPSDQTRVVRAALMAGARRSISAAPGYAADPSVAAANGLDVRFGAGQVSAFNSYRIIAAPPVVENGVVEMGDAGFHAAPRVGAQGPVGPASRYRIAPARTMQLTAALIWDFLPGDHAQPLELDLHLYDVEESFDLVAKIEGRGDTGQHLRATLAAGREYELQVVTRDRRAADTPYALAWRQASLPASR